jgi:hypothetical protein
MSYRRISLLKTPGAMLMGGEQCWSVSVRMAVTEQSETPLKEKEDKEVL